MLHGLKGADRPTELLALPGVGDGLLDHRLAGPERVGRQGDPTGHQRALDRPARIPEDRLGHGALEDHLGRAAGRVRRPKSRRRDPRRVPADDRQRLGIERHQQPIRRAGVDRHQRLAEEATALEPHAGILTAREELREGDAADQIAAGDLRQPILDLRLSERTQGDDAHHGRRQERTRCHRMTEGLGDQRRVQQRQTRAVLGRRHQHPRHAELRQPLPDLAIVRAIRLPQRPHAFDRHAIRQERAQRLLEQPLILGKSEIHRRILSRVLSRSQALTHVRADSTHCTRPGLTGDRVSREDAVVTKAKSRAKQAPHEVRGSAAFFWQPASWMSSMKRIFSFGIPTRSHPSRRVAPPRQFPGRSR